MTTDSCSVSSQSNQFVISGCTDAQEAFLNDFINIVREEIRTGALPPEHFDLINWDEVVAKAAQLNVNSDGSVEAIEGTPAANELGVAGSKYYSEVNPFVNPPKASGGRGPLDNQVNIPSYVWLIAIAVAIGFALQQRGFGQSVRNQIPKIKETAISCYRIVKDNLLKVMP